MRIVLIAPPWIPVPPPAYGGTEMVLDTLARGLQSAGHDVVLFTTGDSECSVTKRWVLEQAAGTDETSSLTELRHVIAAYQLAAGADIVHDHTLVGPVYARRFSDLPVVTTNHSPFNRELTEYFSAVADQVPLIAISHHQASTAGTIPIATVIHHGLDVDRYPFGNGGGGFALFLGRVHPDKGVDRAIDIALEAGVPLVIAAKVREPAEKQWFDEAIRPRLGHGIEFVGEVGFSQKIELLGQASCLLNPVRWHEPFGLVMIEALACGTPVIATPRGAVAEIVVDGVTGFIRDDDECLIAALANAAQLDRRRCRLQVESCFSAERMVQEHVSFYQSVIDGRWLPRAA